MLESINLIEPFLQGQGLKKYVTAVQNPQQIASSSQIKTEPQQQQGIKVENFKVATVAHTQVKVDCFVFKI